MSDPPHKKCSSCGYKALERLIGSGGGLLFPDGAPGQTIRRQHENDTTFTKAKIARRMKAHKVVPMDAHLRLKDIDLSKVSESVLPPITLPRLAKRKGKTRGKRT